MRGPSVMPSVYYVRNVVGISADGHMSDMRGPSVMPSVYYVGNAVGISVGISVGNPSVNVVKSRNFFATLCEIPTGYIPSVNPSVKRWKSRRQSVGECGKIP
jgi:hypothetical protein